MENRAISYTRKITVMCYKRSLSSASLRFYHIFLLSLSITLILCYCIVQIIYIKKLQGEFMGKLAQEM